MNKVWVIFECEFDGRDSVVQMQLCEWGTMAKIDRWGDKLKYPLRDLMNEEAKELINELLIAMERYYSDLD